MTDEEKLEYIETVLVGLMHYLSVMRPYSEIPDSNGLVGRIKEALEIIRG
jgi:hypothetical protein